MYITAIIKAASKKKGGWLLIIRSNNSYGVNAPSSRWAFNQMALLTLRASMLSPRR